MTRVVRDEGWYLPASLLLLAACDGALGGPGSDRAHARGVASRESAPSAPSAPSAQPSTPSVPQTNERVQMAVLDASEKQPTYVLRGARGPARMVFLHGMCGHALGYAQSFQNSAAEKGTLVAPQGDRLCGKGPWADWSLDIDALDRRIVHAFRALGHADPITDIVLMGYSQGATRAEALARKWPERYTRLILIGAPQATATRGLKSVRGAVMMAGERDRQTQMKASMRAFQAAGIPSTFIEMPKATHGEMGSNPEKTMDDALDWLWQNSKPESP